MKRYPDIFPKRKKRKDKIWGWELEENKHRGSTKFNGLNLGRVGGGAGKEIHATLVHTFSTFPVASVSGELSKISDSWAPPMAR